MHMHIVSKFYSYFQNFRCTAQTFIDRTKYQQPTWLIIIWLRNFNGFFFFSIISDFGFFSSIFLSLFLCFSFLFGTLEHDLKYKLTISVNDSVSSQNENQNNNRLELLTCNTFSLLFLFILRTFPTVSLSIPSSSKTSSETNPAIFPWKNSSESKTTGLHFCFRFRLHVTEPFSIINALLNIISSSDHKLTAV